MTALVVAAAVYGLAVGSFLNVVIHRVPQRLSIVRPPSSCPGCGSPIANRDNIPVVSWLALRGRCRSCSMRISARYPAVEALTAGLFVLVALRLGWSWSLPAELAFVAGLVALAFCDLDRLVLPKRIVYPTAGLVSAGLIVAAGVQGSWHRLAIAALCGAVAFVAFFALHMASPRSLGFGDVRLAPVIGLALGWLGPRYAVVGFVFANLLGVVIGLSLIAAKRSSRKTALPYGVFLAMGAVLAIPLGGLINYRI